jgi:hypothetical protein
MSLGEFFAMPSLSKFKTRGRSTRLTKAATAGLRPMSLNVEGLEARLLFTDVPTQTINTPTTWTAANSPYNLTGVVTIGAAGTLTIQSGVTLETTLSSYYTPLVIATGGTVQATGDQFNLQIDAQQTALGSITGSTFAQPVTFETTTSTLTLGNDSFTANPSLVPTYVPSLLATGDTFTGVSALNLTQQTINVPLTLPTVAGVNAYNITGVDTVGNSGALTINNGVTITTSLSSYYVPLVVAAGGSLTATGVVFNTPLNVQSGSSGSISGSTFAQAAEFDATNLTLASDVFNANPAIVPTFAGTLTGSGSTFASGTVVNLVGETVSVPVTLTALTNVSAYNVTGQITISSPGSLTINTGITVTTSLSSYYTPFTIGTGASLTATGDQFLCQIVLDTGSSGSISGSRFTQAVTFNPTTLALSNDQFVADPSTVPTYVAELIGGGDTFTSGRVINLLQQTITSPVTLPPVTGVSDYNFAGPVTVGSGGSLSISNGVTLVTTLSSYYTALTVTAGSLSAVGATINCSLSLASGSISNLQFNTFGGPLTVDGQIATTSVLAYNDLSSALATVTASGAGGPIVMANNWWGSSTPSVIATKITDQVKQPSLPSITYLPALSAKVAVPALLASISAPQVNTGAQAEVITVVYTDSTTINAATFAATNIVVTDPAGAQLTVAETGDTVSGTSTTVTYAVTPPNGSAWQAVDDGNATITLPGATPVKDTSGNAVFAASGGFVIAVPGTAATSTAVSVSPAVSNVGSGVTFTATITPTIPNTNVPTGTVTFLLNGAVAVGTGVVDSTGTATFSTTALPAGNDSITAVYGGDGIFSSSTSVAFAVTENVVQVTTTTAIAASSSSIVAGSQITLTATVKPSSPGSTPTGTVNFFENGALLGSSSLQPNGQSTLNTSNLAPGVDVITATYSGDTNYVGSTSGSTSVTATSRSTTTLVPGPILIFVGDSVRLDAIVLPTTTGGTTLTGTVQFVLNGSTVLGSATIAANGEAVLYTTSLPAGNITLTAVYAGQGVYSGSTSELVSQTVLLHPTAAIAVNVSAPAITFTGDTVTFNVSVSSLVGGTTPTGSVNFTVNGVVIGTAPVQSNGIALFTTSTLAIGSNPVEVFYNGDNVTYTPSVPVTEQIDVWNPGPVPTAVSVNSGFTSTVAGTAVPSALNLVVENPTASLLVAKTTIDLYASLSGVFDSNSILIQSTYPTLRIGAGASKTVRVGVNPFPISLASGDYTLIAGISTPYGKFNYSVVGPKVQVIAPVVTLTGSANPVGFNTTIVAGQRTRAGVQVVIENTGNVTMRGVATFNITLSPTSGVIGTEVITIRRFVYLRAGQSRTISLPLVKLPLVATGNYFVVVEITKPGGLISVISSSSAIAIAAPAINLAVSFAQAATTVFSSGADITITNNGDIDEITVFNIVSGYSLDAAGLQVIAGLSETVTTRLVRIRPGQSLTIHVKAWSSIKPNLAAGTPYYATLTISDASGNSATAVSAAQAG